MPESRFASGDLVVSEGEGGAHVSGPATAFRRAWGLPLWCHAFFLALLLAGAAPFLRLSEAFTIDEGAYAIQVADLDRGGWEFSYRGATADPAGRWLPLYSATRGEGEAFAYVKQPAYPVALLASTRVAGRVVGLHLLALSGALGVAVATWLLAGEVDPGVSRGAFWLAAAGPAAINAYLIWAHAPSAALAGFAALAGLRLRTRFHPGWAGLLIVCVAAGVLLRAEGLLFAIALAVGLGIAGLRGATRSLRAGVPLTVAAVAYAAAELGTRWRSAIVGASAPAEGLRGDDASPLGAGGGAAAWGRWASGRVEGAWHSLLQGSIGDRRGAVLVAAALVLLGFGAWVVRRRPGSYRDVVLALAVATVLYAFRFLADASQPMTGLFAAWPAAFFGLLILPRQALGRAGQQLAAIAGAFALAVLATQYRIGGGREWGGRFFFPLLAPVAVLACLGLRSLLFTSRRKPAVGALLVALVLLPTVTGLSMLRVTHGRSAAIVDEVTAARPGLVVTHVLGLPPFSWKTYPEVGWMLMPPAQFQEATSRLRAAGVDRVMIVGPDTLSPTDLTAYPSVEDVTGPEARQRGWRTLQLSSGSS